MYILSSKLFEMVKVQVVKGRTFISIPIEKAKRWNLKQGDDLDFDFNERGNLELTRMPKEKKEREE